MMMSTGDLKGCLRKLDAQLRALKYPREVDYNGLSKGDPAAFLPIVSYAFISHSPLVAEHLVGFGVELTGKSDLRFIEAIYKVLRDLFHYKPALSKQQFLQFGFAERKTCVLCDVIAFALQKHKELSKLVKTKPRARFPTSGSESKIEILPLQGDTMKVTPPTVSLSRPLVERHLGRRAVVSSSSPSEDEEPRQEEEDISEKCQGVEEIRHQVYTHSQTDPVVEGRLVALEAQLQLVQTRLGRLLALEERLDLLEQASTGTVTIDKHQWENLESRVLLLETRLALSTANGQRESFVVNEGTSHYMVENATEISESRHSPPESLSHTLGLGHVQSSTPGPCYPISPSVETKMPEDNIKERLERMVNMMKDTSSLLQNVDPSK
ncbi:hypothetical protein DPEC_G00182240 [Dallia pectoralis]|uniref:Uncharacterized protein n=1 Tax=Dallia pectoralis TaxID=75939 RepID=A0ACC2GAH2_DALPE|nr:hypothetical protein DPEC_G00182240 [Dallia pectoralis]